MGFVVLTALCESSPLLPVGDRSILITMPAMYIDDSFDKGMQNAHN